MHGYGVFLNKGGRRILVTTNEDSAGNGDSLITTNPAEYFKIVCEMVTTGGWAIEID